MTAGREPGVVDGQVAVRAQDLPDRKYFKIGDVATLVGVEPHVLRYWESQFPQVRPHKSQSSGHRLYRRRDVELLLAIRELVHVQRFTLAGARQALRLSGPAGALDLPFAAPELSGAATPEPRAPVVTGASPSASLPAEQIGAVTEVIAVDALGLEPLELREAMAQEAAGNGAVSIELVGVTAEQSATLATPALDEARRFLGQARGALAALISLLDDDDARDRRRRRAEGHS